jgi:cell division protein FtsN
MELFSREQDSDRLVAKPVDSGVLDYVRLYEKAVLVAIGFVITGIIAFCFGVEKGKNTAVSSSSSRFDSAGLKDRDQSQPAVFTKKDIPVTVKPEASETGVTFSIKGQMKDMPVRQEIILEDPAQKGKNSYTVQIACYQQRESAEKEIARLRQKGFSPMIIKKNGYSVVCVGSFNNKEKAKSLLSQLRSKYRDCYIRRL